MESKEQKYKDIYGFDCDVFAQLERCAVVQSSGEEFVAAGRRRRPVNPRAPKRIPLPPVHLSYGKMVEPAPPAAPLALPQILPLVDVLKHASSKNQKCAGPPTAKNNPEFKEDPAAEAKAILTRICHKLQRPLLNLAMAGQPYSQEQLQKLLAEDQVIYETVDSEIEDKVLGECGVWPTEKKGITRTWPACLNQDVLDETTKKSICTYFEAYGKIGTSWMTSAEYTAFLETGFAPPRRICISCHRDGLTDLVYFAADVGAGVITDPGLASMKAQQYANKKGCPGSRFFVVSLCSFSAV